MVGAESEREEVIREETKVMSSTIESTSILQGALARVRETEEYARLSEELRRGVRVISVSGLAAAPARALALACLQLETGKCFAVVTEANRDLETWERDVRFWYCALRGRDDCEETVLMLPASEGDPYAGVSPHAETLEQRALTLWRLSRARQDFVLLTARALARRTISPEEAAGLGAILRRDEDYAPEEFLPKLLACGYVREDPVGAVGEFSMRGGILDVWPPGRSTPIRIEFFGDTVDSIREFDPETQLSTGQLKEVEVAPMRELAVAGDDFRLWAEAARERWSDERYARALLDRTVYADDGEAFNGWEWLMPLMEMRASSVFDYLKDAVLVVDEPGSVEKFLGGVYQTLETRYAETEEADELGLRPDELYLTVEELRARVDATQRVELRTLGRAAASVDEALSLEAEQPEISIGRARAASRPLFLFPIAQTATEVEWLAQSVRRYHGRIGDLATDIRRATGERDALTLLVMHSHGMAERLAEILSDYDVSARIALSDEKGSLLRSGALITVGRPSGGIRSAFIQLNRSRRERPVR